MNLLRAPLIWYNRANIAHPVKTQILTSGVLWFAGDLVAQKIEGKKHDWLRTCRMTMYGLCVAGPTFVWWYNFLDRNTLFLMKYGKPLFVAGKVFADQCIFEPIYLLVFFSATTALNHFDKPNTFELLKQKVKSEFVSTYIVDCTIWPTIQAVNFSIVPVRYHPLVVNTVNIGWNCFLDYVSHKKIVIKTEKE